MYALLLLCFSPLPFAKKYDQLINEGTSHLRNILGILIDKQRGYVLAGQLALAAKLFPWTA